MSRDVSRVAFNAASRVVVPRNDDYAAVAAAVGEVCAF